MMSGKSRVAMWIKFFSVSPFLTIAEILPLWPYVRKPAKN